MDTMLAGLDCAQAYLDDLLIKSETRHQHVEDIKTVFERIKEYGLKKNVINEKVNVQILPDQAQLKTCPLWPVNKIASIFTVSKLLPCIYTKYTGVNRTF